HAAHQRRPRAVQADPDPRPALSAPRQSPLEPHPTPGDAAAGEPPIRRHGPPPSSPRSPAAAPADSSRPAHTPRPSPPPLPPARPPAASQARLRPYPDPRPPPPDVHDPTLRIALPHDTRPPDRSPGRGLRRRIDNPSHRRVQPSQIRQHHPPRARQIAR